MTESTQGSRRQAPSPEEMAQHLPLGTRGREARVGVFVIFGLLSFATVLFMLTDPAMFRLRHELYTVIDDAGGVRVGDPIQMRGVNIGRVAGFHMRDDDFVSMKLEIERGSQVPLGSTMRLGVSGMFGGRTVEVIPTRETVFHVGGDTIPGEGGRAGGILGSMDDLSEQGGRVLTQVESFLNNETIASVQGGAREFEALLVQLSDFFEEQRTEMGSLIETLQASAEGVQSATEAGPELASAIARADSAMLALNELTAELDGSLVTVRSILEKIDNGEGTFGKLVNDDQAYVAWLDLNERMSSLLADLKENPKKYINFSLF